MRAGLRLSWGPTCRVPHPPPQEQPGVGLRFRTRVPREPQLCGAWAAWSQPRASLGGCAEPRRCSVLLPLLPLSSQAVAHSPIMMPENARTRAATRAEVTTERMSESGRRGSGVGDTGRQSPGDTSDHADAPVSSPVRNACPGQNHSRLLLSALETGPPSFSEDQGPEAGSPASQPSAAALGWREHVTSLMDINPRYGLSDGG